MRTSDTLLREVRRFAAANRADDDPDRALAERVARSRAERASAAFVRRPGATLPTRFFRARTTLRRKLTALGLSVPAALVAEAVLHVPNALAAAAHAMAAGRSISPAAARLADGAFRSLLMTKIRWAATAAAVCLTGVGVLGFRAGGQEPAAGPAPPPSAPAV